MSQEDSSMRAFELDIDDPRLPELQSVEHAEHVRTTFSQHRKQYNQRKASQRDKSSSKLSELIDVNTSAIAEKVKAAIRLNARKRKAQWAQRAITKKRRVTLGKHRVRQVSRTQKASILKCFNRRGGPYGLVHTHQWWALV
ncbi:hypothetical protein MJO28_004854 [Puccinia striiformis f. sp. tritici]|uniref:Uncharacterized protein n=3 Tax=Puccinia striiformis TaxID=27350 RepID=A0A2S4UCP6_9BASI|nr:hypothetical protein Pst134EA_009072 [Puccinia striiformis f. sp. tritici]KAI9609513.1 hypothetical protein H4Q26_007470 [Puccinia striiformis f. sp. tritici PST-130]POV94946.1 hypothetical protein PSHT_15934 [Puccinia striiformis]KAH9457793.1 hypothetical protein Pst134EB_010107 [Puccinia striiformis f. sp. tritici]KAH9468534.1 hypothetical protein Pst134EA_009072 [Puccinia striiformis f. sp. tritici]KAI7954454.1 hypothetical protein MJO28_004854 [Puccinia striiformis f. sp. tritici]